MPIVNQSYAQREVLMSIWTLPENNPKRTPGELPANKKGTCCIINWYSFVLQFFLATAYFIKKTHGRLKKIFTSTLGLELWSSRLPQWYFLHQGEFIPVFPWVFGPSKYHESETGQVEVLVKVDWVLSNATLLLNFRSSMLFYRACLHA